MSAECCPVCGAEVVRWRDRENREWLCDPGVLCEEYNSPDSVAMLSLSGYRCQGIPLRTGGGGRIGWRVHDCSRPPEPAAAFVRASAEEEDDLPW